MCVCVGGGGGGGGVVQYRSGEAEQEVCCSGFLEVTANTANGRLLQLQNYVHGLMDGCS